jgi:4-diphosphocytidyl-2-C-methyl-D-erythritol kinase
VSDAPTSWPAPAKLNLMLRIVGRRDDGYHRLQSVFQFIDLADTLRLTPRDDGRIRRVDPIPGLDPERDLVVRAARLLQSRCSHAGGVDIALDKRIPMGAGLGGGSSDAATTLVALNILWGCGFDRPALMHLGLSLGADVPIFVHGRAAWAEGVGEELTDIDLPEPTYLLLLPDCHVDTGKVFQDPELTRNSRRITIRDFLAGERRNDCLSVVRERHTPVAQALDWLGEKLEARLTGTGSCVFAECTDGEQAQRLIQELPDGLRAVVVRGVNVSPLRHAEGH